MPDRNASSFFLSCLRLLNCCSAVCFFVHSLALNLFIQPGVAVAAPADAAAATAFLLLFKNVASHLLDGFLPFLFRLMHNLITDSALSDGAHGLI